MGEVDLGSCTLDEQQAIKNRARQIIESYVQRTGGEGVGVRRSVVTECEAMAVSYRNEKISYLNEKIYGLESFGYYSLGQQTEIKGYVRQLLAENKSLEEVVVACQEKLNGYGSPPPMRAATIDLMREIEAMENFDSCTPEQQAHIKEHARQMFTGGYKAESTLAVCKYIALLYGANVGESLPESIQEGGDVSGIVEAVERLKKFMKANGGDYGVIDHYYDSQMGSSEGQAGRAMQYHWLTQCQDADNMENNYYFGGHEPVPEGKAKRKDLPKGEKRGKYLIYLNGAPKIYTPDELKAKLERVREKYCGGDQEKYVRTVTMHRAFVAIALEKMDFPGKDPVSHTFTAYRGVNREALCGAYSDYKAASEAGHATIKHTMGESVSIRSPLGAHNDSGTDTHTFDVPFARVVAPYCLHLFAEGTSYGSKAGPNAFWTQREFVCNLQGLEARVKQNH
jgi:hypothetical protein